MSEPQLPRLPNLRQSVPPLLLDIVCPYRSLGELAPALHVCP